MTDPTTIAREVLEHEERLSAYSYSIPLAAQASWDADRSEQVKAAPDLARAVIELTAELDAYREENTRLREQAARVKALADRLDAEAADDFDGVSGTSVSLVKYETAKAIRAALNGETHD